MLRRVLDAVTGARDLWLREGELRLGELRALRLELVLRLARGGVLSDRHVPMEWVVGRLHVERSVCAEVWVQERLLRGYAFRRVKLEEPLQEINGLIGARPQYC